MAEDNGPATINEIVAALGAAGRDVKARVIRRALHKSQFIEKTGEIEIEEKFIPNTDSLAR